MNYQDFLESSQRMYDMMDKMSARVRQNREERNTDDSGIEDDLNRYKFDTYDQYGRPKKHSAQDIGGGGLGLREVINNFSRQEGGNILKDILTNGRNSQVIGGLAGLVLPALNKYFRPAHSGALKSSQLAWKNAGSFLPKETALKVITALAGIGAAGYGAKKLWDYHKQSQEQQRQRQLQQEIDNDPERQFKLENRFDLI
jgi:hypothetical protein